MSHVVGSRLNPKRTKTSFLKQECHRSQVRCMCGLCSFGVCKYAIASSHFYRFPLTMRLYSLYYRLNRALEEAEKYKTALQKAKSQSKVSQV